MRDVPQPPERRPEPRGREHVDEAHLEIVRDAGVAVALLTNVGSSTDLWRAVANEVFGELAGARTCPSHCSRPTTPPDLDLPVYEGRFERLAVKAEITRECVTIDDVFEAADARVLLHACDIDGDAGVSSIPTADVGPDAVAAFTRAHTYEGQRPEIDAAIGTAARLALEEIRRTRPL